MKYLILIYLIVVAICILEAHFCTKEIEDNDEERSACCGARFIEETDVCGDCKEHSGREI